MPIDSLKKRFPWPLAKPEVMPYMDGWLVRNPGTQHMLAACLDEKTRVAVELGAWLGLSTMFMLQHAPNAVVVSIDHWLGSAEHQAFYGEILPMLYETFLVNCWDHRDRLIPVRMTTLDGMQAVFDAQVSVDVVFVDASHDYESATNDISTAARLFPGARIVGDDWQYGGDRHPVRCAVEDCAAQLGRGVTSEGNGWMFLPP